MYKFSISFKLNAAHNSKFVHTFRLAVTLTSISERDAVKPKLVHFSLMNVRKQQLIGARFIAVARQKTYCVPEIIPF